MHVEALMKTFPGLNLSWLLSGEGEMFSTSTPQSNVPMEADLFGDAESYNNGEQGDGALATGGSVVGSSVAGITVPGGATVGDNMNQYNQMAAASSNAGERMQSESSYRAAGNAGLRTDKMAETSGDAQPNRRMQNVGQNFRQQQNYGSSSRGSYQQPAVAAVVPTQVQRKITEIRVYYDDQTWESFVPKK